VTSTLESALSAEVDRLAARGPAHLADRRRAALDAFLAAPLPPRALHLWRYVDPARLLPPEGVRPGDADSGATCTGLDQDGVRAVGFGTWLSSAAGVGLFAALSDERSGKFEALNLAAFSGGFVLEVAPGARPAKPVVVVHREPREGGALAFPRMLLSVGEGAEAAVVEEFESGDAPYMAHAVTEVHLAPGARLVHATVNGLGARTLANLVQRARVDRGASLTSIAVGLGGELVKVDASAILAGERSRSEVLGLAFGTGRQHLDSHFFQDHRAPRTHSDLLVKSALAGRARASYTGRLRIAVDAPGCEAHQENRNLLLSERSRADSIPELEILTHEVQCSHAAATGPVDPALLFYLRSRGLSEEEAQRTVVLGFLEAVFARVPGEGLAEGLRAMAARRLGGG
jgi:Fe-S cluster assembly protein SufD